MLISPAYAQAAAGAAPGGGTAGIIQFATPMILILIVFYLLIHRPQQKKQAQFRNMLAGVKKNDSVVTAGGIVGKVTRVEDAHVEVEIAPNVRIRVVKATLAEVLTPTSAKPAND